MMLMNPAVNMMTAAKSTQPTQPVTRWVPPPEVRWVCAMAVTAFRIAAFVD